MALIGGIRGTRYKHILSRKERYSEKLIEQWVKRNRSYIDTFDLLFEANSYDEIVEGNLIIIESGIVRLEPITEEIKNMIVERIETEDTIKAGRPKGKSRKHNTRELYLFLKKSKKYSVDDIRWMLGLDKPSSVYCLGNPKRELSEDGYKVLLRKAYELGFEVDKDELHYVLK